MSTAVSEEVITTPAISLTPRAGQHVRRFLENRGRGAGLRFGVRTSGCSGLAYSLEFVDNPVPEDVAIQSEGITIFIDKKSVPFLQGTELDFVREGLNEGFKFNNPNVKDQCGCGESFTV